MNEAIASLGHYEDFQVQWIALEADLEEIIISGTVQETEIQSGGRSFFILPVLASCPLTAVCQP